MSSLQRPLTDEEETARARRMAKLKANVPPEIKEFARRMALECVKELEAQAKEGSVNDTIVMIEKTEGQLRSEKGQRFVSTKTRRPLSKSNIHLNGYTGDHYDNTLGPIHPDGMPTAVPYGVRWVPGKGFRFGSDAQLKEFVSLNSRSGWVFDLY